MKKIASIFKKIGIVILVSIILICIPFTVPKLFGMEIYQIATGSMSPELPIGTVIYIDKCDADDIEVNDIISFYSGTDENNITTHRVVEINDAEEYFITKGDANDSVDANSVSFSHLLGKEVFSIQHIGKLADFINSINGIILGIGSCVIILVLWICSDLLSKMDLEKNDSISKKESVDKNPSKSFIGRIGYKYLAVYAIAIVMIIIAGFNIFRIVSDYGRTNDLYEDLASQYTYKGEGEDWYNLARIDLDKLREVNGDIVGWIIFENEDINYPVLKGKNDDQYIHTSFDGKQATAGSIFMESENSSDFEDYHTIIYGHNMRNLSMFGKLKYYNRREGYYDDHQYFQIFTGGKIYRYRIFAYNTVAKDSYIYKIGFEPDNDYQEFLDKIIKNSFNNDEIEVSNNDKIITLSTCSTSGEDNRFVVHAVRVDEYEINDKE